MEMNKKSDNTVPGNYRSFKNHHYRNRRFFFIFTCRRRNPPEKDKHPLFVVRNATQETPK